MSQEARWKVEIYSRGDSSPVIEFLEQQSRRNQAKTLSELDDMVEFGVW